MIVWKKKKIKNKKHRVYNIFITRKNDVIFPRYRRRRWL